MKVHKSIISNLVVKATIYQDTPYEISWTLDIDSITPDLVERIEDAGTEINIDWSKNQFYAVVEFLLENFDPINLEERLFDEDPDLIDLIILSLQNPLDQNSRDFEHFVRLYIPVIIIILRSISNHTT